MNDIKLDIPNILVAVDVGDNYNVEVSADNNQLSVDVNTGDNYNVNLTPPSLIDVEYAKLYYKFADYATYALTASSAVSVTSSFALTASSILPTALPPGTVSSSNQVSYLLISDVPSGIVSSSEQVTSLLPAGVVSSSSQINSGSFSGSFAGTFVGDGSQLTGIASDLRISGSSGSDVLSLLTDTLVVSGVNGITTVVSNNTITIELPAGTVSSSTQATSWNVSSSIYAQTSSFALTASYVSGAVSDWDTLANKPAGLVSSSAQAVSWSVATASRALVATLADEVDFDNITNLPTLVSSSNQISYPQLQNIPSGIVSSSAQAVSWSVATASYVEFVNVANTPTLISSSVQVDVRNTIGIETLATTASNTFTGTQSITDTTNSTSYNNGALVVYGGVGVGKDLYVSGNVNIDGLLTVVSMSTQYITSSQYTIGTSRIILNDDDLIRFAGLSIVDSGSASPTTASIFWDSLNHKFIYQNLSGSDYGSAMFIGGPKNTGSLGDEIGLIEGRVPVATGEDHIDTSPEFSPLRIVSGVLHVENGLHVTGSITSSNMYLLNNAEIEGTVSASNINVGIPTSNPWQSNLEGSYFNNFTTQTDVSEILRFIAGLLSSSAPDASPNTKFFNGYNATAINNGTGTVTAGTIPQNTTNTTIAYLTSKGFGSAGSTLFSSITPIYTGSNFGYRYTSIAGGTTIVSSSNDAQLFGLGQLSSGNPTTFNVSGSFVFRFKDNSVKTDTATSGSTVLLTQAGAGTTNGVSLAKINTANPAVIPAAYQDGKFSASFNPTLFSGSATGVSSSGYYHISSSIQIASGSSGYTPVTSSNAEIFYAPLPLISTNVGTNTIAATGVSVTQLSATSRSLSGAPYLSGSTYVISGSVTGLFNPLFFAGAAISSIVATGTGITATSGVNTVSTAGGVVSTANAIFDFTGVTPRATSTVPFETDIVKVNGLYTFAASTNENINQIGTGSSTFTLDIQARNKDGTNASRDLQTIIYHAPGGFGQPAASGGLAYWGATQGTDSSPSGASSTVTESFLGEGSRIQLTDAILSFTGLAWNTTFGLYNLGANDLQVKPGFLVRPGGTYGYWITNPSTASSYKYYVRRFQVLPAATKTSMTLNLGQALVDWQATTNNSVAALILFESSNSGVYTPARLYDPTKLTSNFVTNIAAATDGQNPFGSQIALYGNTGGSLSSTTYTIPIRNADGMFLNTTYNEVYVIVRYNGDPTPVTSMTVTFS